jgi:hypothetical protein
VPLGGKEQSYSADGSVVLKDGVGVDKEGQLQMAAKRTY